MSPPSLVMICDILHIFYKLFSRACNLFPWVYAFSLNSHIFQDLLQFNFFVAQLHIIWVCSSVSPKKFHNFENALAPIEIVRHMSFVPLVSRHFYQIICPYLDSIVWYFHNLGWPLHKLKISYTQLYIEYRFLNVTAFR